MKIKQCLVLTAMVFFLVENKVVTVAGFPSFFYSFE